MGRPSLREQLLQATEEYWRRYAGSAEFWEDLRADLELEKQHPAPEAIRRGLASGRPVPEWAADYIAGRLAGTVKLPRGRPTWSDAGLTFGEMSKRGRTARWIPGIERSALARMVVRRQRALEHPDYAREYAREYERKHGRIPPKEGAYQKALGEVSAETGVPADTLDKYVYPRYRHLNTE